MTPRQTRLLLRLMSSGLMCFAVMVGAVALLSGSSDAPVVDSTDARVARAQPVHPQTSPKLEQFATVWHKKLRRQLYDPKPEPPKVEPPTPQPKPQPPPQKVKRERPRKEPQPPKLDVKLVGTMLERGHSMAIFMDPNGRIKLKAEGETLGFKPNDALVETIGLDEVTLRVNEQIVTVQLPKRTFGEDR